MATDAQRVGPSAGLHALDTVAGDAPDPAAPRPKTKRVRRDPRSGNQIERDLLLQRVSQSLLGESVAPTKVGRFTVVDELGRGAMGVVFRAFDPKLDRKVAIKLVGHGAAGTEAEHAQRRLEREARAAADLSHPNIVTVYDAGVHDEQVFLAMEFVDGDTLSTWLTAQARSWREVARMFVGIARGLGAAHNAGVVHRDLKPDNVLVDAGGQPKIADFGLARQISVGPIRGGDPSAPAAEGLGASPIASTNSICGTPAYMAPEQFAGLEVTPASDQFAFFVSLHEGLYGIRPHAGASLSALAAAVIEGRRVESPADRKLPRALVQLIDQGLATDPEDRHATMGGVADRLEEILQGKRRRIATAVGFAVATIAGASGMGLHAAASPAPCETADAAMTRSEDARAVFRSSAASTPALADAVESYASRWSQMATENCEATRVEGGQSEHAMDLRAACLARANGRLDGALASMTTLDEAARGSLDDFVIPLSECDDVEGLERLSNRFSTQSARSQQSQVDAEVTFERGVAQLLVAREHGDDTYAAARSLVELAEQHQLPERTALAWSFVGEAQSGRGQSGEALQSFEHAVVGALATGQNATAANATASRIRLLLDAGQIEAARTELIYLEGLARGAEVRPVVHFVAGIARAQVALLDGRTADAIESYETALSLAAKHRGMTSAQAVAATHINLGHAFTKNDQPGPALQSYGRALDLLDGDADSPFDEAVALLSMGSNRSDAAEFATGRTYFRRAAAKATEALGDDNLLLAQVLGNRGVLERKAGELETAKSLQTRSLRMREARLEDADLRLTYPLDELAQIELALGNTAAAHDWASHAAAIAAKSDPAHTQAAVVEVTLAEAELALGHPEVAAELLGRLVDDPRLQTAPVDLARAQAAKERLNEASTPSQAAPSTAP